MGDFQMFEVPLFYSYISCQNVCSVFWRSEEGAKLLGFKVLFFQKDELMFSPASPGQQLLFV